MRVHRRRDPKHRDWLEMTWCENLQLINCLKRFLLIQGKFASIEFKASSQFTDPSLDGELKELFKHISRFKPQEMDLETELKPFIPDFIPAIGDIDAFIKANRSSGFYSRYRLDDQIKSQIGWA